MRNKTRTSSSQQNLSDLLVQGWYPVIIIASLVFLVYIRTVQFKFSPLDDLSLIVQKMDWLKNIDNIKEVFTKGVFEDKNNTGSYYRPLLTLSFMIDAILGKGNPAFFHFSNLAYHIIASILCFFLLQKIIINRKTALFLSMVFAVHPVLVQAVSWIPGRNDTLLAIFVFSGLIFFMNYLESGKIHFLILHLLFFVFILMTKESAIIFPVITILLYYILKKDRNLKGFLLLMTFWMLIIVIWFIMKNQIVKTEVNLELFDLKKIGINAFQAFIVYFGKAVIPFPQSILPNMKDDSVIPGLILIAAAIIVSIRLGFEDRNKALFGLIWMITFLSIPLLLATFDGMGLHYEHRMYVPLFGLLIFISQLKTKYKLNYIVITSVILLFSIKSFVRSGVYRDKATFSNTAVNESPSLPMSFNLRGQEYKAGNKLELAAADFSKALTINPKYIGAIFNLGVTYSEMGRHEEAIAELNKGLLIDSLNAGALYARGNAWSDLKKEDKAIADYSRSISLYPGYDKCYNNRGNSYARLNEYDKAIADFTDAIRYNPKNASAYSNRANVYSSIEKFDLASKDIEMALMLKPGDEEFLQNKSVFQREQNEKTSQDESFKLSFIEQQTLPRALDFYKKGDYTNAAVLFLKLYNEEKNNPNSKKALSHYNNYGQCLYKLKRLPEAENVFSQIILRDSKYEKAYLNLANINKTRGNLKTAKIMYQKVLELNPNNAAAQKALAGMNK